jgi:hypothetical protein
LNVIFYMLEVEHFPWNEKFETVKSNLYMFFHEGEHSN